MEDDYIKGRGAQKNTANSYEKNYYEPDDEYQWDDFSSSKQTKVIYEEPKTILSTNQSPDVPNNTINPYRGCEHGCIYCYARPTHEYWGYSAGLDFETKIIAKKNAAALLEKKFQSRSYKSKVIVLSGNTDCYQPIESKLQITRSLLNVFAKYRNPVGIITKNDLILRDLDILKSMAKQNLVHVMISLTTLNEELRRKLEPRTVSGQKKLKLIKTLTENGIPSGVMMAPVIPSLNNTEIPEILKQSSEAGALSASFQVVRLNGPIAPLFHDWLNKNYPDRAEKVWKQINDMHGGTTESKIFGKRMRGEGLYANTISQLFKMNHKIYFKDKKMPAYNFTSFTKNGTLTLF